jgi:hypothetical protein
MGRGGVEGTLAHRPLVPPVELLLSVPDDQLSGRNLELKKRAESQQADEVDLSVDPEGEIVISPDES